MTDETTNKLCLLLLLVLVFAAFIAIGGDGDDLRQRDADLCRIKESGACVMY